MTKTVVQDPREMSPVDAFKIMISPVSTPGESSATPDVASITSSEGMGKTPDLASSVSPPDTVIKKVVQTEKEVKPIFEQRLKDQTAMAVGSAELEVKVLGSPEPEVTWEKDGAELPKSG